MPLSISPPFIHVFIHLSIHPSILSADRLSDLRCVRPSLRWRWAILNSLRASERLPSSRACVLFLSLPLSFAVYFDPRIWALTQTERSVSISIGNSGQTDEPGRYNGNAQTQTLVSLRSFSPRRVDEWTTLGRLQCRVSRLSNTSERNQFSY